MPARLSTCSRRAISTFESDRQPGDVPSVARLFEKGALIAPLIEELHETRRDVDPHRIVGWAGFQQQTCMLGFSESRLANT
jgi:hypothetical protein